MGWNVCMQLVCLWYSNSKLQVLDLWSIKGTACGTMVSAYERVSPKWPDGGVQRWSAQQATLGGHLSTVIIILVAWLLTPTNNPDLPNPVRGAFQRQSQLFLTSAHSLGSLLLLFCREGNQGTKKLSSLYEITQLNGEPRNWTQESQHQNSTQSRMTQNLAKT